MSRATSSEPRLDPSSGIPYLLDCLSKVEGQLQELWSEHGALRAEIQTINCCLDKSGVLPAKKPAPELQIETCPIEKSRLSDARPDTPSRAGGRLTPSTPNPTPPMSTRPSTPNPTPPMSARHSVSSTSSVVRSGSTEGIRTRRATSVPRGNSESPRPTSRGRDSNRVENIDLYVSVQEMLNSEVGEHQRHMAVIQRVLKQNPQVCRKWSGPSTPLNTAVRAGHVELTRVLLTARADPSERDAKGASVLHAAVSSSNSGLCKALLTARSDVSSRDSLGQTPVFFAPTVEICKLLYSKSADLMVLNKKGQSPLHTAGIAHHVDVLSWLSSRLDRCFVELKDSKQTTAWNYALPHGSSPASSPTPRMEDTTDLAATLPYTARLSTDRSVAALRSSKKTGRLGEAVAPGVSLGHSGVNLRKQTPRATSAPQTSRERDGDTASAMHKRSIRFGSTMVCATQSGPPVAHSSTASTASTASTGSKVMQSSGSVGSLGSKVASMNSSTASIRMQDRDAGPYPCKRLSRPKPGLDSDQTLDLDVSTFRSSAPALGAEAFTPIPPSPRGTRATDDFPSPPSDTNSDNAQYPAKQAVPEQRKLVNAELEAVSELVFDCNGPESWERSEQESHKDAHKKCNGVSSPQNCDGEDWPSVENRIAPERDAAVTNSSAAQMPMDDDETF